MTTTISGTEGISTSSVSVSTAVTQGGVASQKIQLVASKASTSGTSVDFTNIPSWVKRVTVSFNQVSTSGSSPVLVRIGSTTPDSTAYNSNAIYNGGVLTDSTGYLVGGIGLPDVRNGSMVLTLLGANIWVASGVINVGTNVFSFAGTHATGAGLSTLRVTTANGTDVFDSGSISMLLEGY